MRVNIKGIKFLEELLLDFLLLSVSIEINKPDRTSLRIKNTFNFTYFTNHGSIKVMKEFFLTNRAIIFLIVSFNYFKS